MKNGLLYRKVKTNYATGIVQKTGLINQGIAVCFNLSNGDNETKVREWVKSSNKSISVTDLLTNWNVYPAEVSYPLSGIFVKALIDEFGNSAFIKFVKDQTYANGKLVFGEKPDGVIREV